MKTFELFIESEAFFPVLILLLIALVGVFMWIIMSDKREIRRLREKKNIKIDENAKIKFVSDTEAPAPKVEQEEKKEEPPTTEVSIVEEVNVDNDYFKNYIDDNKKDFTDNANKPVEEISVNNHQVTEEVNKEVLDIPSPKEEKSVEENTNAFNKVPDDNREVNENIQVEEPHEYKAEKTEVFDFPNFNEEDIFSSGDIEEEIIDAANNYIKDIMSKKQG